MPLVKLSKLIALGGSASLIMFCAFIYYSFEKDVAKPVLAIMSEPSSPVMRDLGFIYFKYFSSDPNDLYSSATPLFLFVINGYGFPDTKKMML